ncbi:vascular endothelial growth factor A-like isoform X2 [Nelusetta ayraudi]|uniref:vascular endothelial growth factor A-like isoform X2 n=1 Tax=Nelusetta ayraudi TaxID=303726 RepID=UPI003F6F1F04
MQLSAGLSPRLLLALLLQLTPAQLPHPPLQQGRPKAMALHEVWAKSMCQPMEQLVDVEQEYPGEVEHFYMPACVPLKRCNGCCGDESLECRPTLERNVTLQVRPLIRIQYPMISMAKVELTFVEHQKCDCSLKVQLEPLYIESSSSSRSSSSSSSKSLKNRFRRKKHKKTEHDCGKC